MRKLLFGVMALSLASCAEAPCDANPCGADATCSEVGDSFVCDCNEGFYDDGESCCADGDEDHVCDAVDNCAADVNQDQEDFNSDGVGDACDEIVIPLADLSTDAIFFEYQAMDVTVHYFAVLADDGSPHVAVDACDVCYAAKKGYRQEGDQMICNNCGQSFDIEDIGDENQTGGCNPGYIVIDVTDTAVIIQPEALEMVSWYF